KRLTKTKAERVEAGQVVAAPEMPEGPEALTTEAEPKGAPAVSPSGTTVKRLTLSPDALKQGIKPGDKLVREAPTRTGSLVNERGRAGDDRGRRPEFRGTPGETAAPQMTYTPPADNRRRPGRSGGRRGKTDEKGAKWAERDLDAPQKRSI